MVGREAAKTKAACPGRQPMARGAGKRPWEQGYAEDSPLLGARRRNSSNLQGFIVYSLTTETPGSNRRGRRDRADQRLQGRNRPTEKRVEVCERSLWAMSGPLKASADRSDLRS